MQVSCPGGESRALRTTLQPWVGAMCLALAGCGAAAPGEPSEGSAVVPWFEEIASARGLVFRHESGHRDRHWLPEIIAGGAALFDMDGDGDLDAYFVQSGGLVDPPDSRAGNQLLVNLGEGTFRDVSGTSGADDRGYGMGVAAGDYDQDGDVDLYVTNVGPNVLLRNDGAGRFTDVSVPAGVGDPGWGASAAFVDHDADGDLDLFVTNYLNWSVETELTCPGQQGGSDYCSPLTQHPLADVLFRNDGDGTFTDVSEAAGLRTAFGNGLGLVLGDFDGSGTLDLFVANDKMPNQLWLNRGGGRFEDRALVAGVGVDLDGQAKAGMGVDAVDLDDDADLDLIVVNLRGESDSVYRNQGAFFSDDTIAVGLRIPSRRFTRFGLGVHDFDNDGRLDLYEANGRIDRQGTRHAADPYAEPNLLFRGLPNGQFGEVAPPGGTRGVLAATSRAAVFGDIDNDGGIDVVVVNRDAPAHLLRNIAPRRGHWITFRVMEATGGDALGASVRFSAGARRLRRDVKAAYGYFASNDPRVHVGLGSTSRVTDVTVRWVDGRVETFGDFDSDRIVMLRRGDGRT